MAIKVMQKTDPVFNEDWLEVWEILHENFHEGFYRNMNQKKGYY